MDTQRLKRFVDELWDRSIVPELCEYVRIPNKSPVFDRNWAENGHMDRAVELLRAWCQRQPISGMTIEVLRLPQRTPLLFIDVPGQTPDCVLMYGHLDKQPEFTGWKDGLEPWQPVIRDGRLYGRGGADDGYAVFGSLAALMALEEQGIPHGRAVILIEASEESGSPDLPAYIDVLSERLGSPRLVVCLDAECGNYEQLWCTTSLRGNVLGSLRVDVLQEGVHSGAGSGIVASSFRILRQLLARVEDANNGDVLLEELHAAIPEPRRQQARQAAAALGDSVYRKLPFVDGMRPVSDEPCELLLNNTWRPTLAYTGIDGIPGTDNAGNVLRPWTTLKLSFRLPPTVDPSVAGRRIKEVFEHDPPYGARVRFTIDSAMGGWNAPPVVDWLERSMHAASRAYFGRDAMYMGTGGSIPFMGMLGEKFPETQFLVTGVLGPQSNAHGPNEFLHIATGKAVTACVAGIIADYSGRSDSRRAA